ncbi:DUF3489 domain-containing protein [Siccirubricoccus deserti]|uniref:DUF3489 domain-containing protein n=2 Tax=Siccirubricoccus deserti TaxID=2013562 RepID=A0A9X0R1X0_9PROT|nr:DUF3489 domain-containing protein [Siccirubricoccus deserti]
MRAIGIDPNEGDRVADTGSTVAPEVAPGAIPAPADEAAQGTSLAEDIALLHQALASPAALPRTSLRDTATAVLAAWDDETNRDGDMIGALDAPMERLRALLAKPAAKPTTGAAPRKPREGTKQETVLTMLRRPEGATVAQIAEATGWAQHTVRGFFAGLKKKGIDVRVLERVRQVGPNKEGARGSYTIYRIARAG